MKALLSPLISNTRVYLRCLRRRTRRWRRDPAMPVWVLRLATWRKVRRFARRYPTIRDTHECLVLTPGEQEEWAAMTRGAKR